jgi:hypothetical protein
VNRVTPIVASEAIPVLYQQTYHFEDVADIQKMLQLLGKFSQQVNLFRLECNMEDSAAQISYLAMSSDI